MSATWGKYIDHGSLGDKIRLDGRDSGEVLGSSTEKDHDLDVIEWD